MTFRIYVFLFKIFLLAVVIAIGAACTRIAKEDQSGKNEYTKAPPGFPPVPFPPDNPITPEKAELGRRLFYEKLLSKDKDIASCSHCMKPEHGFSDNDAISIGANSESEYRNTMCITNSAYRKDLFWDGRGKSIEGPAYRSLWMPVILSADTNELQRRLEAHPLYPALFRKAFGPDAKPTAFLVSRAIATFVRTLISGNSKYDKYKNGDKSALNEQEIRGMNLFFSERLRCSICHSGFLFTDGLMHNTGVTPHYFDRGRYYVSGKMEDRTKFITPSLRNCEVTGPYMHNGAIRTLDDVIEHYNLGGYKNLHLDTLLRPLNLKWSEKKDLVGFLKALTDREFLDNPRFKKPAD